jgi:uncharacterized protein (DUF3820 family)
MLEMQKTTGDNKEILLDLVRVKMPFGKYKGTTIAHLPEYYLVWFKSKGFPAGKLGILLETCYEIKLNGLDDILRGLERICQIK